jgi:hypothetical protein
MKSRIWPSISQKIIKNDEFSALKNEGSLCIKLKNIENILEISQLTFLIWIKIIITISCSLDSRASLNRFFFCQNIQNKNKVPDDFNKNSRLLLKAHRVKMEPYALVRSQSKQEWWFAMIQVVILQIIMRVLNWIEYDKKTFIIRSISIRN